MALWLDLIPRLHRSDDLDARYHQLDDFADRSSFDEDGTRQPEGADLALLRSLATARTAANVSAVAPTTADAITTASGRRRRATTAPRPTATVAAASRSQAAATAGDGGGRRSAVGMMSLVATVGIGFGLLVVNAVVLSALYCKRGRLTKKRRQQLALLAPSAESAQLVDADRYTAARQAYICRRTTHVDGSSSAAAVGCLDGDIASTSVVSVPPPPPPPPESSSPRRRTLPSLSRSSHADTDHMAALISTSTKPDNDPSRANAAILMSVTSYTPAGDVANHVTSSSTDTVV